MSGTLIERGGGQEQVTRGGVFNKGRQRILSALGAVLLVGNAVFPYSALAQTPESSRDPDIPTVPNTAVPEPSVIDFGDSFSEESIERRKQDLLPIKFMERYPGRDDSREVAANERLRWIWAAALGHEAGGLAYAARDLNQKTTLQANSRNNTPNGMTRLIDFGRNGVSQIGVIAPVLDNCYPDSPGRNSDVCPPIDPDVPVSIIRGISSVNTADGRTIFSLNHLLVVGQVRNVPPNDLGSFVQSVKFVRENVIIADRQLLDLTGEGVTDTATLKGIVANPESDFNKSVRMHSWAASLETAKALDEAMPGAWQMSPAFREFYQGYREVLPQGQGAVLEYISSRPVSR